MIKIRTDHGGNWLPFKRAASGFLSIALILAAIYLVRPAFADDGSGSLAPQGVDTDDCLACHDTPGLQTDLPSGEPLNLTVDSVTYKTSIHGRLGYACVQCHTNIEGFPHDSIKAQSRRDFSLQLYTSCTRCHQEKYEATLDSVHQKALAAGNEQAAVCTDCHGAHDIGPPNVPRSKIPQTCQRCHSEIYETYSHSVHGEALLDEGNPDVPTCIDCHGVHNVQGPDTGSFRLFSPQICAECHADEALMDRYGISTDVFDSYVSDFHGETVVLFEKLTPDQETNKPVCIDCHGVHDMRKVDDPQSKVIKANLLTTCQKCHPDANTNFPDAWLSHYRPSLDHSPVVYGVNLFYAFFIPTVIGSMVLFVLSDVARRIILHRQERRNEH